MDSIGLDQLDIGINVAEMGNYKAALKHDVLDNVSKIIDEKFEELVIPALNQGWQGEARDEWEKRFKQQREEVKQDLKKEYQNIENRLEELESFFKNIDRRMI